MPSDVSVSVDFVPPRRFFRGIEKDIHAGILRATIWAARKTRESYGSDGGGPFVRRVSKRTGRVYWSGPGSRVGGYPAIRSQRLRDTTDHETPRNLSGAFGARVSYAKHVHAKRPFLELTARRHAKEMAKQFEIGYRSSARKGV